MDLVDMLSISVTVRAFIITSCQQNSQGYLPDDFCYNSQTIKSLNIEWNCVWIDHNEVSLVDTGT